MTICIVAVFYCVRPPAFNNSFVGKIILIKFGITKSYINFLKFRTLMTGNLHTSSVIVYGPVGAAMIYIYIYIYIYTVTLTFLPKSIPRVSSVKTQLIYCQLTL